ncbi:T9SS type A sorting domain-containing protein [Hymenobacter nivis]|uniref:T9SS C-terminal target domain-containing protein n=1 Tax=Hymenobacter nivis TaxID=1850093 RepID=A0A502H2L8_9BACT|nr:T9SS type A sorting domain-containing protein [Hymenobacter nivis]TPG67573.1 T9SS C-terminal target domain-containing protein [Hymenobacter nivis]
MKKLLRTGLVAGLLFAAGAPAHAQAVANGGFETWAARSNVDSPTGWLTVDDAIAALSPIRFPTGTFTKTTDAHGGTYALRLETKTTLAGVVPGGVVLGTKLGPLTDDPGGLPFTGRPTALQFYYKLTGTQPPVATNGAFAAVSLTRTVNGQSVSVATGTQIFNTVNSAYVLAQVPLVYTSSAVPDSVHISFGSGLIDISTGAPTGGTAGTVFQVDDVVLTGTATAARDAALAAALTVAPNPSPGGRYVLRAPAALLAAPLAVVDATGRTVRREGALAAGTAARTLDLAGLAGGVYTLQLFTDKGLVTKKLLVE